MLPDPDDPHLNDGITLVKGAAEPGGLGGWEWRGWLRGQVKGMGFTLGSVAIVLASLLFPSAQTWVQSDAQTFVLDAADSFFGQVFALELAVQLMAHTPRRHYRDPFSLTDLLVVLLFALQSGLLSSGGSLPVSPFLLRLVRLARYVRVLMRVLRLIKTMRLSDNLLAKHHGALEFVALVMRGAGPLVLSGLALAAMLAFIFAVIGQAVFGDLCLLSDLPRDVDSLAQASGAAAAAGRRQAARCLLVAETALLPRHGASLSSTMDGMATLALVATLDGWTKVLAYLQLPRPSRAAGYMTEAAKGLRAWIDDPADASGAGESGEDDVAGLVSEKGLLRLAGLRAAAAALSTCASTEELESLRAEGLMDCGREETQGGGSEGTVPAPCRGTCISPEPAPIILALFIVASQFVLLQLVSASILQMLRDPFAKVEEERGLVTDRMIVPRFRAIWRRWRRGVLLRGPVQAAEERMVALGRHAELFVERDRIRAAAAIATTMLRRSDVVRARRGLPLVLPPTGSDAAGTKGSLGDSRRGAAGGGSTIRSSAVRAAATTTTTVAPLSLLPQSATTPPRVGVALLPPNVPRPPPARPASVRGELCWAVGAAAPAPAPVEPTSTAGVTAPKEPRPASTRRHASRSQALAKNDNHGAAEVLHAPKNSSFRPPEVPDEQTVSRERRKERIRAKERSRGEEEARHGGGAKGREPQGGPDRPGVDHGGPTVRRRRARPRDKLEGIACVDNPGTSMSRDTTVGIGGFTSPTPELAQELDLPFFF
mmetsp:Transcript_67406/g.180036  ORF Transcript_67406/g.180036 Transcript_67406/m.180036 type:complete len:770 (+) Transcript_67406:2561-4870(+)